MEFNHQSGRTTAVLLTVLIGAMLTAHPVAASVLDRESQASATYRAVEIVGPLGGNSMAHTSPATAPRFSRAKQIYAPPTKVARHCDLPDLTRKVHVPCFDCTDGEVVAPIKRPERRAKPVHHKVARKMRRTHPKRILVVRPRKTIRLEGRVQNSHPAVKIKAVNPVDYAFAKARSLYFSGRLYCATMRLREVLFLDPSNARAKKSLDDLLDLLGFDPRDAADRLALARHFEERGKPISAMVEYRAALALKPSALAHAGLGRVLSGLKDYDGAQGQFADAIAMEPLRADLYREQGILDDREGDTVDAAWSLNRAVVLDPMSAKNGDVLIAFWQRHLSRQPADRFFQSGLANARKLVQDNERSRIAVSTASLSNTALLPGASVIIPNGSDPCVNANSVRLELYRATPYGPSMRIDTTLRNDTGQVLSIPSALASVTIRNPGRADSQAWICFTDDAVSAHGQMHGLMVVPGSAISEGADLLLPNWLPGNLGDLHLTRPMAPLGVEPLLASRRPCSCQ